MDRIYLIGHDQTFTSLVHTAYDSEDLLQSLLAQHPDVLSSDQIGAEPRRWLLISRETPVPDREDASGRWSLDHLFLDQDGIPTLIEVKRSTDTRIRREVVGQMLDYAANAVTYWKVDEIRARYEAALDDEDPDQILADKLGIESAADFWASVETNLRAGKIRMIFVADEVPYELRRIVEFLNEQMSPAEVLAVAIRQYAGENLRTLVPTVYGQTAKAQTTKSSESGKRWSEETFFPELTSQSNQQVSDIAYEILKWAKERKLRIWWGKGRITGSFIPMLDIADNTHWTIAVWTNGYIEIQFQYMLSNPPFSDEKMRYEFWQRLNAIEGVSLPEDSLTRRPSFLISALSTTDRLEHFFRVLDWYLDTARAYQP